MKLTPTLMTIAEYCGQMASNAIVVNRDYQRSPKRWPPAARAFLIDSILQGYPIPKVILAQQTDLKTKTTVKEIVDGQQRSMAIRDFFEDQLRITGDSPYAGKTFSDLEAQEQQSFLTYPLGVDVFTGADDNAIRQTFRRMNSYTVPLNKQEQRYATHQGLFKWFIFDQTGLYAEMFKRVGVFGEKQISAMQDGLLLTELAAALVDGIKTSSNPKLDKFYRDRDTSFPEQEMIEQALQRAFDLVLKMPDIHGSSLMKPHQFYTLTLAAAHSSKAVPALVDDYAFASGFAPQPEVAASKLGTLALAIDSGNVPEPLEPFVNASSGATNTEANRKVRFQFCCKAIAGVLPE